MIDIDLHGFELVDAKTEIYYKIIENPEDNQILVIHGYKMGKVLRNYVRSNKFIDEMKRQGIIMSKIVGNGDPEGTTTFSYKIKK